MSRISPEMLLAFQDELDKMAALPGGQAIKSFLAQRGGAIGAGAGVGALAGGIGGAGIGAVRDYRQARQQGASRGQAAFSGALGGLMGGMKGSTIGLVAGGTAGGLASGTRLGAGLANLSSQENTLGGAARYGQRQLHGLTGWTPEHPLGRVQGLRALKDPDAVRLEKDVAQHAKKMQELRGVAGKERDLAIAERAHGKASKRLAAVGRMEEGNLTNLPGLARGLVSKPGETVKTMWEAASPLDKAVAVGMPAMTVAGAALSKPQEGQPGRAERIGGSLGALGSLGQSSLPTSAFAALSSGVGAVGKYTGRGIDKLMRRRQGALPMTNTSPGMEPQPGDVSSGPIEYNYSNSALGRPPEGMGV